MSGSRRALFALVTVVVLGVFGFMCQRVAERGRFARAYSTYGAGAEGTRALFLLAERMGARPVRWAEDFARLPASGGMLVALGSCDAGMARPMSRFEAAELDAWIQGGGVLLVAGARHSLPDALGVRFEPEPGCDPTWRFDATDEDAEEGVPSAAATASVSGALGGTAPDVAWVSPVAPPLVGLGTLPLRSPGRFVIDAGVAHTPLLTMPDAPTMPDSPIERVAGVIVPRGRGRVIALASASLFQNRAIVPAEGGPVFARLVRAYAPAGPVLFDEYHLGIGERRSFIRYLRQRGLVAFFWPLAAAACLALWRAGARFGEVRVPEEPPAAGTASFVDSLGRLFLRTHDPAGAVDLLRRQALARIARRHHLPLSTARALAEALRARGATEAAVEVERIMAVAGALGRQRGDLVGVARRIDEHAAVACR